MKSSHKYLENKIVITGIGIVSGYGVGNDYFWNGILNDTSAITKHNLWSNSDLGEQFACKIPQFNIENFLEKLSKPLPLRFSQVGLLSMKLAVQNSLLQNDKLDN